MPTLYLVATPIGNLEDMSGRAIRILRSVSCIAAEDTRETRKLLSHFNIPVRDLVSFHDHNQESVLPLMLEKLAAGDLALVSDAGTPGINDPGYLLVQAAVAHGHKISPIPGTSAPLAALVGSGLPSDSFLFLGYLPRKKGERRSFLQANAAQPHTLIFLETPHRLADALRDLAELFPERRLVLGRELTKLHEEFVRGRPAELLEHFEQQLPSRGEFTLVMEGFTGRPESWDEGRLEKGIAAGLAGGEAASALAKRLAAESGRPRREIYKMIQGAGDR